MASASSWASYSANLPSFVGLPMEGGSSLSALGMSKSYSPPLWVLYRLQLLIIRSMSSQNSVER